VTLGQHLAVAQYADRTRDLEDDIHVVLDEDERHLLALPQAIDLVDHAPAFLRAHAGGRFIEQQHARLQHQRQRDIQKLLVAMRQIGRQGIGLVAQAEHVHHLTRALATFGQRKLPAEHGGAAAMRLHGGIERFRHGERREDAGDLKGAGNAATHDLGMRHADEIGAVEHDAAVIRLDGAGNQIEEGGLAGAVRPDHRGERAGRKFERDVAHRGDTAEGFGKALDQEHGL